MLTSHLDTTDRIDSCFYLFIWVSIFAGDTAGGSRSYDAAAGEIQRPIPGPDPDFIETHFAIIRTEER